MIKEVKEIKAHCVLLDNDKWYKYYQVMKVNVTEQKHVKALNELAGRKKNTTNIKREGFDLKHILRKKRNLRR